MKENKLKDAITHFYNNNYKFWQDNQRLSIRQQYLSLLKNVESKNILDMGCGIGLDAEILSMRHANGIGVDISKNTISICNQNKINNWLFYVGDSETVFFQDKFDIVISIMEMMYHSDLAETIKHYSNFLNDKGKILLVVNNPYLISIKFHLIYSSKSLYHHEFKNGNFILPTYHRPIQSYIYAASTSNLTILDYKEIYCNDDDCKKFSVKNTLNMPEFIVFLFGNKDSYGY